MFWLYRVYVFEIAFYGLHSILFELKYVITDKTWHLFLDTRQWKF